MKDRKARGGDRFAPDLWLQGHRLRLNRKVCGVVLAKTKGFKHEFRIISNFFVLFLSFLLTFLAFVHTLSSSKRNTDPEIP
jgi:hypothetical protein